MGKTSKSVARRGLEELRIENQLPKGLNTADHAGHHVFGLQHVAIDFDHGLPGGTSQFAQSVRGYHANTDAPAWEW